MPLRLPTILVVLPTLAGSLACVSSYPTVRSGAHAIGQLSGLPIVDVERERAWKVFVWYPAEGEPGRVREDAELAEGGPFPLIMLAHGIGGPATSNRFVAEHLAQHGFVVVAPKFPLSIIRNDISQLLVDVVHHPGDVSLTIDAVLGRNDQFPARFVGRVDPNRVGMIGMSLGGLATYLTTYDRELRDPRIKLAATMAGVGGDLLEPLFFEPADPPVPLLLLHGTADAVIDYESVARPLYQSAPPPKYLLTIEGGSHSGFSVGVPILPFSHPDRLVCWFFPEIDIDDESHTEAYRALAERVPPTGLAAIPRSPLPCTNGAQKRHAIGSEKQMEIANRALLAFALAYLGDDGPSRRAAEQRLRSEFGDSLEATTSEARRP